MHFLLDHIASILGAAMIVLLLINMQQDRLQNNIDTYQHYTLRVHAQMISEILKGDLSNMTSVTDFQKANGLFSSLDFEADVDSTREGLEEVRYTLTPTATPCKLLDVNGAVASTIPCYTLSRGINGGAAEPLTTTLDTLVVIPRDESSNPVYGSALEETQVIQVEFSLFPPNGSSGGVVPRSQWRAFFRPEMLQ